MLARIADGYVKFGRRGRHQIPDGEGRTVGLFMWPPARHSRSMREDVLKVLTSEAGDERVLVVRRTDGVYVFRRGWHQKGGWSDGPDLGLYDSAETAETEARARVSWLIPALH